MNKISKICGIFAVGTMMLSMTACGKKSGNTNGTEQGEIHCKGAGEFKISVAPKYNPLKVKTFEITVTDIIKISPEKNAAGINNRA